MNNEAMTDMKRRRKQPNRHLNMTCIFLHYLKHLHGLSFRTTFNTDLQ